MLKNLRFSPRGTGGSTNLYCGSKEEAPFVANPTADRSLENVAAQLERGRLIAEACARELLKHCGPERLLWGSDWPFANAKVVPEEVRSLTAPGLLSDSERAAIDRGNALALFPRLNPA